MAESITFNSDRKVDKTLIRKLNAVAPYQYDDITGTARRLLHERLDQVITELNITVDFNQPASVAG